jgi:isoleucyl-tRNA synthetase
MEANKSQTSEREEQVLAHWKETGAFEKSIEKEAPNGDFIFYDGPPFATGLPHMGHLLGSTIKDVVGRYKTMRGYHVPRRWGWDCHGLPIENMIEKKLELKSKKDIEELGLVRFNEEAKKSVLTHVSDWKRYIERLGRWVDFDNSYKTMDNSYIEGVWGALKKVHDDGRLYEGKKVLMYCPHCETPLAKAEIAMDNSYKDVTDESAIVRFKILDSRFKNTYILAWTTTPWTLPGNMALAVGFDVVYDVIHDVAKNERYIIAHDLRGDTQGKIVGTVMGKDLVGLSYEPLYEVQKAKDQSNDKTWKVLPGEFVTTEEGTGVVHIAPMYGEDDYQLGKTHELPMVQLLDSAGHYNDDAPELVRGQYYKKGGKAVTADLEERGLLFAKHSHNHSYPHCYRCSTALIYNALSSWFINIQDVKQKLLSENQKISWYPEHLKEGRFKYVLENAPDWNISRNRFWASPLPIWKHEKTGEVTVLGSLNELRARTKKSGNTYLVVRHGQAESNVANTISNLVTDENHLTEKGKEQLNAAIEELKKKGITKIIASPLVRTRESAEQIAQGIGYDVAEIVFDERIQEWQLGELNGKPVKEIWNVCPQYEDRFKNRCPSGETLVEMKHRIGDALYELERTYQNETILIVGHEYTAWLAECVAQGADIERCVEIRGREDDYIANGEVRELDFVPLPHNCEYELDLHRPYIDEVELLAEDGTPLTRIPEVVDCWVESGSMPIAAERTFGEPIERPARYPGDFIAEYIAQTRTWFNYMHTMGVLLFDEHSFKHCVTTGTVLAEDGSKMSKSKNNFTDPMENLHKYGADALRLYLMGSVVMQAEDMNFRDEELKEMHNRVIGILWNTYKFYEMYATEVRSKNLELGSRHILDQWVVARLNQTITRVTEHMDAYDTVRTVRELREFVTDLSTWYLRRSRDRLKGMEGTEAQQAALATFKHILTVFAKLLAPITPFIAESMYQGVVGNNESVHLAAWPAGGLVDEELLATMETTRSIVSAALELRSEAGIKVRQPLASLTVSKGTKVFVELIQDELNVKEVREGDELALDTVLTDELKQEGEVRELIRRVQDERKKMGLSPDEKVTLQVYTDDQGKELVAAAEATLEQVAGVKTVEYVAVQEGTEVLVGTAKLTFAVAVR